MSLRPSRYSLLGRVPSKLDAELIEELVRSSGVRIERIVSAGHRSEEGFWYDQEEHEWVVVLQGRARLRYEEGDETHELDVGDAALIPAHVRHRVEWTDPDTPTVWLAVFWLEAGVEAL